ncbi:unnamed protein product [Symbiodinium sp. CCMP2592]|nr:unnamed protein product [Symbiodinium sp. CCMP2592]
MAWQQGSSGSGGYYAGWSGGGGSGASGSGGNGEEERRRKEKKRKEELPSGQDREAMRKKWIAEVQKERFRGDKLEAEVGVLKQHLQEAIAGQSHAQDVAKTELAACEKYEALAASMKKSKDEMSTQLDVATGAGAILRVEKDTGNWCCISARSQPLPTPQDQLQKEVSGLQSAREKDQAVHRQYFTQEQNKVKELKIQLMAMEKELTDLSQAKSFAGDMMLTSQKELAVSEFKEEETQKELQKYKSLVTAMEMGLNDSNQQQDILKSRLKAEEEQHALSLKQMEDSAKQELQEMHSRLEKHQA